MANWSRQDSSSKFRYEGDISSAWFDISISKKTSGCSYIYRYGMIGVARLYYFSFTCFSMSSLSQSVNARLSSGCSNKS